MSRLSILLSLLSTLALAASGFGLAAPSASAGRPRYLPPIDAPVIDRFRPPASRYGPGNRGWDYDTRAGQPVVAIAAGTVIFAGTIAGQRFVTVRHTDGLLSSYSWLASLAVGRGDVVAAGERIGTAGERVQLGIRRDGRYLDPAILFGGGHARLVPVRGGGTVVDSFVAIDDATQILNLLYRYAELIDEGDFAGVGELLAGAEITAPGLDGRRGASGIEALYVATTKRHEDGTPRTVHVITNPIVEISSDGLEARVRSRFTVLQAVGDLPLQPVVAGRYDDHFVNEAGSWRFASRHMEPRLLGELRQHLHFGLEVPEAPQSS